LYSGEAQRPNTLTWVLTMNGATLSKDMAQRCIIIKLARPESYDQWTEDVDEFIARHRWEIIGDAIAELKRGEGETIPGQRWAPWRRAVLSKMPNAHECWKLIQNRQNDVDDEAAEADLVRDAFREWLKDQGYDPDTSEIWISSKEAAEIVENGTGEKRPSNKANAFLKTLVIPELRKSNRHGKGWLWTGKDKYFS
jgi:hypothetical protein